MNIYLAPFFILISMWTISVFADNSGINPTNPNKKNEQPLLKPGVYYCITENVAGIEPGWFYNEKAERIVGKVSARI